MDGEMRVWAGNAILQGFRAMRRFHVEQSEMDRVAAVIQAILDYRIAEDVMCERMIEGMWLERSTWNGKGSNRNDNTRNAAG